MSLFRLRQPLLFKSKRGAGRIGAVIHPGTRSFNFVAPLIMGGTALKTEAARRPDDDAGNVRHADAGKLHRDGAFAFYIWRAGLSRR